MKRSWMGFLLLVVLLAGSILVTGIMIRIHEPIEADLQTAAEYAQKGNWVQAHRFFRQAEAAWTRWEHLRACFADHNPVEEIDAAFALVKVYGTAREELAFGGSCRELARKVAAVGQAHEFVWWNLL